MLANRTQLSGTSEIESYTYKRVFSLADSPDILPIYLVVPALAWFVKTTYLKEESKSELNVMLEIG